MAESFDRSLTAKAAGATGSTCTVSGPYRSSGRNAKVIVFMVAGSRFPPDTDGNSVTWSLVSESTASITAITL